MTTTEGWAHGTRNRYKHGCRCDLCREAKNEYYRLHPYIRRRPHPGSGPEGMARARSRFAETGIAPSHGTYGYKLGCRCQVCRDITNAYQNARRARKREEVGMGGDGSGGGFAGGDGSNGG